MKLSYALQKTYDTLWKSTKDGGRSRKNASRVILLLGEDTLASSVDHVKVSSVKQTLLSQGLSSSTVNRLLSSLSSVLWTAYRSGARELPPPSGLRGREGRGRKRTCIPEEILQVSQWYTTNVSPAYGAFVIFLAETGFRVSEAHGLCSSDLCSREGRLWATVRNTKNGEDRSVPLSPAAIQSLEAASREGRVWKEVNRSVFSHGWVRARRALGLEHEKEFVPHSLRHTRASTLLRAGVPVPSIQAWLGHKDIKTTMRYAHTSEDCLVKALEAVQC